MGRRWAYLLLLALAAVPARSQLDYNISTTWNGGEIDHDPIQLTLSGSPDNLFLDLDIEAPFFNDQQPPNRNPVFHLWKYEVVEAYFLNGDDQYLQVQLSPHGHHNVFLFNGSRVTIRRHLPLDYKAEIHGNTWNGKARIPVEYLPNNVTKFNAFGMHGPKINRVFESLYPAFATEPKPNFHVLEYFEDIDLTAILPNLANADMSELWRQSLENYRPPLIYYIESTWNGGQIDHEPIRIELSSSISGNELELIVDAPFFNKQPAPPQGSRPVYDLWKYEVVEAYFLNDKNQYLQVQLSPYGHQMVYLFNGSKKFIRSNLPMPYKAEINGTIWKSKARIPVDYLPTNVVKFNAFAMHGLKPNKVHESLYPANKTELKPDFHVLEYFKPIDLNEIMPGLATAGMSEVWKVSLESSELELQFNITSTWNGGKIDHDPIQFNFSASPKGNYMELSVIAPFFNDQPAPPAGSPLSKYEVVEASFLNEDNQYLQVLLSPYGNRAVLLLNGYRGYIRSKLPIEFKAEINGNTWTGKARIPVEYFPSNVTKFNLFGQHGSNPNRSYESLFPAPSTEPKPNFHILKYFKAIDLTRILPGLANAEISEIWRDSLDRPQLEYNISTTWNGGEIDHNPIQLTLSGSLWNYFLELDIEAPFFNDQQPPNGNPVFHLWKYEVVEAYFLNGDDQYLQVQLSPHGHHNVFLFNGSRVAIRRHLPLDYKAEIHGNTWNGKARIPVEYLPNSVTKFNAFGMHGPKTNRVFESLYPAFATEPKPNFHVLEYFEDIDLTAILPNLANADMSELWRQSLENYRPPLIYYIESTWNGGQIDHEPIRIELSSSISGNELELIVDAPFFNKQPAPPQGSRPVYDLWKYEVVEAYFLNDKNQYLQVQLSPYGHQMVYLFNGSKKFIRSNLPMPYKAEINGTIWKSKARIPVDYLPTNVVKFNAFAMHGLKPNKVHESLYPANKTELKPDFHVLEYFKPIDLNEIMPGLATAGMSEVWKVSLESSELELQFNITSTWNGGKIDHDPIQFNFSASPKGNYMELSVIAPFFNDQPAPPAGSPLSKYEVVEASFLNEDNQYLQVLLSPYGNRAVLLLNGYRGYIRSKLPIEFKAEINGNTWTGKARIPVEYFPSNVTKFNLFGQHGSNPNRSYESLFPAPSTEPKPNFHILKYFKAIDLTRILPGLANAEISEIWRDSLDRPQLEYNISTTWNGGEIDHNPIQLTLSGSLWNYFLELDIEAPFFNDQQPPNGNPVFHLWKYEVVEAYFLNGDDQYLQVQLSPHGHHNVFLFNGSRVAIRRHLPLDYKAEIHGNTWNGKARIPVEYLPNNVTKFNAFGMHGPKTNRVFESLYPALATEPKPNYHVLEYFEDIDLTAILPNLANADISELWRQSLENYRPPLIYYIESTWNGGQIDHEPIRIELSSSISGNELELFVDAPFFNKQPAPPQESRPVYDLWKYEVVEAYFLNDKNQYLQVQLSPYGHQMVYLFNGSKKFIRSNLPMAYKAEINGTIWKSKARIPVDYLPTNVVKFNAFAMHGLKPNKVHESLYPANKTELKPDFHVLEYFKPIDLNEIMPGLATAGMSEVWKVSLESSELELQFNITSTWNGGKIDHDPIQFNFSASPKGNYMELSVIAPFFNDQPAPPAGSPLSKYEVVEASFLNEDNQYLQVLLSPYGNHAVLLLNGYRGYIRSKLPIEFKAEINRNTWTGKARIPVEYFPSNVTKFNLFGQHGSNPNRSYESLFPAPSTEPKPDFHILKYFKAIDLTRILPGLANAEMSEIWRDSLDRPQLDYNISTTWNGGEIDHNPIQLTLSGNLWNSFLELDIEAPFFNDQQPPNGNLVFHLWKYEVVEAYFLNGDDQYLQVQLSPHGQYNVFLFNGSRVLIRRELPLDYKAEIHGNAWNGKARIPVEYLPNNVTKFNAYGMHGPKTNRVYESLHPAFATEPKPNFHILEYFEDINLTEILPRLANADMSELWRESLENYRPPLIHWIESTWNGGQIDHEPIRVELRSSLSGNELELLVDAPFFNKQPAPPQGGRPVFDLWKYEVVEAYFLNDKNHYILVQMSPYGQRMVYLYDGSRKFIRSNLPLEYEAQINGTFWKSKARIPVDYLPTNVTKFNAFAIHGLKPNRVHESLYPAPKTELKPNFHVLEYFKPIDLNEIMPGLASAGMSEVWKVSLKSSELELRFNITSTWNGGEIDHDPIQFKFSAGYKGNYMDVSVIAPFFNDQPAPPAGSPLSKYEVVEAYFLNDDNHYLQVLFSPYGNHVVLLLNGSRGFIRSKLPIEYKAEINGNTWTGKARIPVEYLPSNVTKFNLFGQHGSQYNRSYESLFPAPSTEPKPDFHVLKYFKAIDLTRILPGLANAGMSEFWRDSIEGIFRYRIQTAWNGKYIYHRPAEITLQGFNGGVQMNVTAPFFNDTKPGGKTGKPFYGLWDYEVIEMFFLNNDEEYLEVELGPWGEHLLLVLKGARHTLKHSLHLDYIIIERTDPSGANPGVWRGSALIPPEYFPPKVNRMNAYAIHGTADAREYQSLYPAPYGDPDYAQADFHRLELFQPIDFRFLVANNSSYSDFWREAIASGSASLNDF